MIALRVVDAQRRLRHVGDRGVARERQSLDVAPWSAPAPPARVPGPSYPRPPDGRHGLQDHHTALRDVAFALTMDLGHQRTGCVQDAQPARLRVFLHGARDAMRTEDGDCARRYLRKVSRRSARPWRAGSRQHDGCVRSRAARKPARQTSRAPARRCRWPGSRRRKNRAAGQALTRKTTAFLARPEVTNPVYHCCHPSPGRYWHPARSSGVHVDAQPAR